MIKISLMTATMLFASATYGACESDSSEIGDTGPASQLVCKMLESRFPQAEVTIIDREIYSANKVSVIANVDSQEQFLTYQLVGADWRLVEPSLARNDETR